MLARIAVAESRYDDALRMLGAFEQQGGLVVLQLYADRAFQPLGNREEWKALFRPRL